MEEYIRCRDGCILTHGLIYTPFTVILSKFPSRSPQIHRNQRARELSSNAVTAHKNHTYSVTTSIRYLNRKWMSQDPNPFTGIGIRRRALFPMVCCCVWARECYRGTTKEYQVPSHKYCYHDLWLTSHFYTFPPTLPATYIWLLLFLSTPGHKERLSWCVIFCITIDKRNFEPKSG